MNHKLEQFEDEVNEMWMTAMNSSLIKNIQTGDAFKDKRIVAIYLTQVYHYAVHTPRHQAMAGININNKDFKYMQYCFEHAYEETGHELMAIKDIQSLGYSISSETMLPRLPSTDKLISFLYDEARSENPIHHLGYGFWSENACPFIGSFMQNLIDSMGLNDRQLTFYTSHVQIDEGHASEVRKVISNVAKEKSDWEGILRVAKVTFDLTVGIVRESFEAYKALRESKINQFSIFS